MTQKRYLNLVCLLMVLTGIFAVVSSFIAMFQINGEIALWTLVFLPILGIVIWYYQKFSSSYLPKYAGKIKSAEHEIE